MYSSCRPLQSRANPLPFCSSRFMHDVRDMRCAALPHVLRVRKLAKVKARDRVVRTLSSTTFATVRAAVLVATATICTE